MLTTSNFYGTADAHTRRVTLNLIRASTVCPDDLVFIIDDLAARGWDWASLTKADAEAVYGLVNDDLVEAAKAEFAADTSTVVDLDRHRRDAPQFIDADGDTFCPLCGHKHVRWGFTLTNTAKHDDRGRDLLTGSTCVVQYGLRVDGSTTAEAALASLNAAIARLTRKAEREDWQAAHPDHAAELAIVARMERCIGKDWYRHVTAANLPRPWGCYRNDKHNTLAKWARATAKFYAANGFLTPDRTEHLYGSGALASCRAVVAQVEAARETPTYRYWETWLAEHPLISPAERATVVDWQARGYGRGSLYAHNIRLVLAIEERHTVLPPPPPPPGGIVAPAPAPKPSPKPVVLVDDVSDLPGL